MREHGESSSPASAWCRRSASAPRRTGTALLRRSERHRPDHQVRRDAVRDPDRGRGQGLRSAAVHREERRQEDGRLHPVRDRRVAVRDGRCRADDRRRRSRRASACSSPRASAGSPPSSASTRRCSRAGRARSPRSSFPSAIINLAAGQVSIRFGAKGPNSATCTACSASAHAIGDAFEIIRRGAADVDDRRRLGGGDHADGRRRLRRAARAVDAQRRAAARQPAVRQGSRRLHRRRRRRRPDPRGARAGAGARRADLRRAGRLRHVGRRVPHHRAVRGRRRRRSA